MPIAYEGLSAVQVGAALENLSRARDRVSAIISKGQNPGGTKASEYDVFVASQLKVAIEGEIANLRGALLTLSEKTATGAATLAAKHYSIDVARFGVAPVGVDARTIAYASDVAGEKIVAVSDEIRAKVRAAITHAMAGGLSRGDLVAAVTDAVAGKRTAAGVERIIRTEVGQSYEQSQVAADVQVLKAGGDLIKRWRSRLGPTTRDDHFAIDGQERELDDLFDLGGGATADTDPGVGEERANAPHDPTLSAGQAINCQCYVERVPRSARTKAYIAAERPALDAAKPLPTSATGGRGTLPTRPGSAPWAPPRPDEPGLPPVAPPPAPPAPPPAPDLSTAAALAAQAEALPAGAPPAGSPPAPVPKPPPQAPGSPGSTQAPAGASLKETFPPGTPLLSPTGKTGVVKGISPSGISGTVVWDDGKEASVYGTSIAKWANAAAQAAPYGPALPPAPAVPPAAEPQPIPTPKLPDLAGEVLLDATGWKKVGKQSGSNPGGLFVDPDGVRWYVKQNPAPGRAENELLAGKLYGLSGIAGPELRLVKTSVGGKVGVGIASRWVDGVEVGDVTAQTPGVAEGFAVDAWLANHDVVGLGMDNLGQVGGKAFRIDVGGSLLYRAQGAPKGAAFGDVAGEIFSLRDPSISPQGAAVFAKLTPAQVVASIDRVLAVPAWEIEAAVLQYGPGTLAERQALAAKLLARQKSLAGARAVEVAKMAAAAQPPAPPAPLAKLDPTAGVDPFAEEDAFADALPEPVAAPSKYLEGVRPKTPGAWVETKAGVTLKVVSIADDKLVAQFESGTTLTMHPDVLNGGKVLAKPPASAAPAPAAPPPEAPKPAPAAPEKTVTTGPLTLKVGVSFFEDGDLVTIKKIKPDGYVELETEGIPGTITATSADVLAKLSAHEESLADLKPKKTTPAKAPAIPAAHPHAPKPDGPAVEVGAKVLVGKGKIGTVTSYAPGAASGTVTYADGSSASVWADSIQKQIAKASAAGLKPDAAGAAAVTAAKAPAPTLSPKAADPVGAMVPSFGTAPKHVTDLPPPSASGEALTAKVKASKHSFETVKGSGASAVGVDYGGGEWQKAKAAGWFATEVSVSGGSPVKVYAKTAADAKYVVAYLKAGGKVGAPQLSALLGYSPQEIADYKATLVAAGKNALANAKPLTIPHDVPVPAVEAPPAIPPKPELGPFVAPTTADPRLRNGKPWERAIGAPLQPVTHPDNSAKAIVSATAGAQAALRAYTGSSSGSMNTRLYSETDDLGFMTEPGKKAGRAPKTATERKIADLQDLLLQADSVKEPIRTYRGVHDSTNRNAIAKRLGLDQGVGAEVVIHGFQSTSSSPSTAASFAGNPDRGLLLEIVTRRGMNVVRHSQYSSENEWLLPSGLRFRIVGYETGVKVSGSSQAWDLVKLEEVTP